MVVGILHNLFKKDLKHEKRDGRILDMIDIESGLWQLIEHPGKVAIPILVDDLIEKSKLEINLINEEISEFKRLDEQSLISKEKFNELNKVLEELDSFLKHQSWLLENVKESLDTYKIEDMLKTDIVELLNQRNKGGNSEFSQYANKIIFLLNKVKELKEKILKNFLESNFIVDERKGVIIDIKQNLMWELDWSKQSGTWSDANNIILGKSQGWRLPTLDDFKGLFGNTEPSKDKLEFLGFQNVQMKMYWTSKNYDKDEFAMVLDLSRNILDLHSKDMQAYIILVRNLNK